MPSYCDVVNRQILVLRFRNFGYIYYQA